MGTAGGERLRAADDLDALKSAESDLTRKRPELAGGKRTLGSLDADGRREAGLALNQVSAQVAEAAAARRTELEAAARAEVVEAERLDLTEVRPERGAGHLHLVTQTMEELE